MSHIDAEFLVIVFFFVGFENNTQESVDIHLELTNSLRLQPPEIWNTKNLVDVGGLTLAKSPDLNGKSPDLNGKNKPSFGLTREKRPVLSLHLCQ